jgi:beta-phosphoglucomutase family hydrolase
MKNTKTRAVIWDMDGVIADTGPDHYRSWHYAFQKQGINFTEEDFRRVFGQRNDTIIGRMLGREPAQSEIDAIAQDKEEFFRETVKQHLKPFPGVVNLLKTLRENGIAAAIASSAPPENIHLILSLLGLETYFQAIVYGHEVTEGKPSPQGFLLAARKLGADPKNCIVIEDAVAGVQAAKRAGMRCIAVTNTHPAADLAGADLAVGSLEKVGLEDLNRLFSKK